MKRGGQMDLLDCSLAVRARAARLAAQYAAVNPHMTPQECAERSAHYLAEAEALERAMAADRAAHDAERGQVLA